MKMNITADKVVSWLVPFLLSANLGVLVRMSQNIADMAKDIAVVAFKADYQEGRINKLDNAVTNHESRITILEAKQNEDAKKLRD